MASCWLREVKDTNSGESTGTPFFLKCLAWFLVRICGFTNYTNGANDEDFLTSVSSGTDGEFNISGTDKDFRDTVASGFTAGMVNNWLVVADANRLNAGIYKITAFIDATRVTLDFRSGAAEYPVQTTGVDWWVISATPAAATGTISGKDGTTVSDGDWVRVDDGDSINDAKVVILSRADPGTYTPNNWRGGVLPDNPVNVNNRLVGKTVNFTVAGSAKSCTFTGSSPLPLATIVSQINTAAGSTVCHIGTSRGYETTGGKYIIWRTQIGGVWGKPNDPPASDGNDITVQESGSTAWEDLGFSGGGDRSNPYLAQGHRTVDNNPDPDWDDASEVAEMIKDEYNGHNWLTANRTGSTVNLTNTKDGAHGNKTIESGGISTSGMTGGSLGTMEGNYFRCRTPHANGWEIEVEYVGLPEAGSYQFVQVRVSTNGDWAVGSGKVLGPIKFGCPDSRDMWFYAFGDDAGEYVTLMAHNNTDGAYIGSIVANIVPSDAGLSTAEQVALMGCKDLGASEPTYDHFLRDYNDNRLGHGYMWWDRVTDQVELYMVDLSYYEYGDSLTQWGSREVNARRTNAAGFDQEDVIAGTYVVADPANEDNHYSIVGKLSGLYSVREQVGARTTFDEASSGAQDFLHVQDGLAFEWPEVTPQH